MPVTATTAQEIFIGAGDVYVDDVAVGATMDDNVFRVVQEKGTPQLNGVPGPLIGLDYISSETAELEVTIPELGTDKLAYAVPGATALANDGVGVSAGILDTTLAADTAIGATNLRLTSVTGLVQGQVLQIGASGAREFRKIVTVGTAGAGGTGVDVEGALTKAHVTTNQVIVVTSTTLAADAPAGSTNLKVASVAGLVVGDYVRFGYPGEQEVRKLTFVGTTGSGGTGVSFAVPTQLAHRSGDFLLEQTNEGGTTISSGTGSARRIPSAAYHKWELRVPGLDGREVRFVLAKAIMTENAEFTATDDPEAPLAPRLTLQARWDPASPTTSPWTIERLGPTA